MAFNTAVANTQAEIDRLKKLRDSRGQIFSIVQDIVNADNIENLEASIADQPAALAGDRARDRLRKKKGRRSTILTSSQGITDEVSSTKKTLLGS